MEAGGDAVLEALTSSSRLSGAGGLTSSRLTAHFCPVILRV